MGVYLRCKESREIAKMGREEKVEGCFVSCSVLLSGLVGEVYTSL
jgi:hypothetical protein